jgi:hypothetical protein
VIRWLTCGEPPSEAELDVFREHASARAAEGIPRDLIPANFRRGARFAWRALLEAATDDERPALLESADLLFEYVDRVSRIFSEVYETARVAPASAEEVGAGALLARISAEEPPLPEDQQLADRIGFRLERAARPFVIACPDRSAREHGELAAKLRGRQALATSEGRRVVGLSHKKSPWEGLELDARAVITEGPPAIGGERGAAIDELREAVQIAAARGRHGIIGLADHLPEMLLTRSPRLASQIRARIYGPLDAAHPELARTLDVLVEHSFEKGAAAAALPVHRNTLRDRIGRISEITGVDLERVEGRGLAWLAWLARRDWTSGP